MSGDRSGFEDRARDELRRIEEDLLYTEKSHFQAAQIQGRIHLILGLCATATAATAAASIVASGPVWIGGVSSLVSAVAAAVLTFTKPEERAQQHHAAGNQLGALRVRSRK